MAFSIRYHKETGLPKDDFGDEAVYDFVEGGVLKVVSPDTNGKISYTPSNVWFSLFADKNHPAGGPAQKPGDRQVW